MNMLPAVNVRLNHHDGNVAPHVSLGRSYVDRLLVPAESRTAAQILVDRDATQAELDALEANRPDVLVNGSVEDLLALDTRIALAKAKQDQAEALHAAAAVAEARADHERQRQRRRAAARAGHERPHLGIRQPVQGRGAEPRAGYGSSR